MPSSSNIPEASSFESIPDKVLVLGTAQLGMDYGITNLSGRISSEEALRILEGAWRAGIRHFDTAPGYGSEKLLGEFVSAHSIQSEIHCLTKIPRVPNGAKWSEFTRRSIDRSLEALRCDRIEALFFHHPGDQYALDTGRVQLMSEWPINHIGVSIYDPAEIAKCPDPSVDPVYQFPLNVFDRRFEQTDIDPSRAYARSVLLQGVLANSERLRPNAPVALRELQTRYHQFLRRKDIDPLAFALGYVLGSPCCRHVLIGVANFQELRQIVFALKYDPEQELLQEFLKQFGNIDHETLDPRTWS